MKVLISWSGERSKTIAELLRQKLKPLVHSVDPWMSDNDISAGQRWSASLAQQLADCRFGIICVTPENLNAPWLMFEAGALAKSLGDTRVVPFLYEVEVADLAGPLTQFQAVSADRDGFWKLMKALSQACGEPLLSDGELRQAFENSWHTLENDLSELKSRLEKSRPLIPRPPTNVHIFQAPDEGKYNEPFYTFFTERIAAAQSDIYVTGDGFECTDPTGTKLAESYCEAFRTALANGVNVVRIQTKPTASQPWSEMLAQQVKEFPNNFALYIVHEDKSSQLSSVCVIDPDDPGKSLVELMLSTSKFFGAKAADLAGTAVFIENQQAFAQDLRGRILQLREVSTHLTTPMTVKGIAEKQYYFAFGSNMSAAQMKSRCGAARKVGNGVIIDHELVFNRKGSYRPGGVASVRESSGDRVYGVIWEIDASDLAALDELEDPDAYRRSRISVSTLDGEEYKCVVYQAIPQGEFFQPDEEYIDLMVKSATEAGLPKSYIEELVGFKAS